MDLCKYKNLFGEPNKGVHKYRFMGMAVVDWALTILLALITTVIWWYNNKKAGWQKILVYYFLILFVLILLGIILHWLFCVDTALNRYLGL